MIGHLTSHVTHIMEVDPRSHDMLADMLVYACGHDMLEALNLLSIVGRLCVIVVVGSTLMTLTSQ